MTTVYTQPRAFLPVFWRQLNFTSGQATALPLTIPGFPSSMDERISIVRQSSLVTVGIMLSAALTAGLLRFELTIDGTGTGDTIDMVPADGARKLRTLAPGKLVLAKGDRVGVQWGSSGAMAPSGSIDGVIFLEVQPT